ncbi:MAG: hypothetical protein HYZ07_02065 [Candidatus Harrisonbacteria bacterium]|nr:hypothetical protein [Candidatus Harrisonbacteria bacterium]
MNRIEVSLAMLTILVCIGIVSTPAIIRARCSEVDAQQQIADVVVVNETDTTLTVIFVGENGNRGTDVPPRLAVAMGVNPEHDTLEVKAIAYRKDGSVAGIANHVFHLKSPKETGWWKVNQWDL